MRATPLEKLLAVTVAANLTFVLVRLCVRGFALFGPTAWERVVALATFAVMIAAIVRVLRGDARGLWMCLAFYALQMPQFDPRLPWIWLDFGYNPLVFADPGTRFNLSWTAIIGTALAADVLWQHHRRRGAAR